MKGKVKIDVRTIRDFQCHSQHLALTKDLRSYEWADENVTFCFIQSYLNGSYSSNVGQSCQLSQHWQF